MTETPADRIAAALDIIDSYGGIDGEHHKTWVIDQVVRKLCGTQADYEAWIVAHCDGEDGPNTYAWDEGIAP